MDWTLHRCEEPQAEDKDLNECIITSNVLIGILYHPLLHVIYCYDVFMNVIIYNHYFV